MSADSKKELDPHQKFVAYLDAYSKADVATQIDLQWVPSTPQNRTKPVNPVKGGKDPNQQETYIGRAIYEGEALAAKVLLTHNNAYVAHDGENTQVQSFEFLTGLDFDWVKVENKRIPDHAVSTGISGCGDTLFIGRSGEGQIVTVFDEPSVGCRVYPPSENDEVFNSFEVLVQKPLVSWVPYNIRGAIMEDAFVAERDLDGHNIHIGRSYYKGELIPGFVVPEKRIAQVCYFGIAESVHQCEILCGSTSKLDWITYDSNKPIPANAIPGGHDVYHNICYIGRVKHDGKHWVTGKVLKMWESLYYTYDGLEIGTKSFEILVAKQEYIGKPNKT